jgi:NTE family protein
MKALVISGGGSKGAFAVGVLTKLIKEGEIKYDIIGGTSTGALMSTFAYFGMIAELKKIYTTTRTDQLLTQNSMRQAFDRGCFMDTAGLEALVNKKITENMFNRIKSAKLVYFATVCLNTGDVVYFHLNDMVSDGDYKLYRIFRWSEYKKAIMASSNQPVLMPYVNILGKQYVDGGIRENIPIRGALYNGATEIDVISMTPKKIEYNFKPDNILSILQQTINITLDDALHNDIELAKHVAREKGITIRLYRPKAKLPIDASLEFKPEEMQKCLDLGIAAFDSPEEIRWA